MLIDIFDTLGEWGPIILFVFTIFVMRFKHTYLFYYCFGMIISIMSNYIIKGIIKEPRPGIDEKKLKIALKHNERFIYNKGIPYDIFGMPSGHSQRAAFTALFTYLTLKDTNILIFQVMYTIFIMYQRVYFDHHTILQCIMGIIVGIILAYIFYYIATNKITGNIKLKLDDYAKF